MNAINTVLFIVSGVDIGWLEPMFLNVYRSRSRTFRYKYYLNLINIFSLSQFNTISCIRPREMFCIVKDATIEIKKRKKGKKVDLIQTYVGSSEIVLCRCPFQLHYFSILIDSWINSSEFGES